MPVQISTTGGGAAAVSRILVTEDTVLSGADDIRAVVTELSASLTVTLPAASTSGGQRVWVTDHTGTVDLSLAKLAAAGADTIRFPGGSTTRLLCWRPYATIALVSDGVSAWIVESNTGWYIDPQTLTARLYFDARRGVTLTGSTVTAWTDTLQSVPDAANEVNPPVFVENSLNGMPGVRFDGVNDVLWTPSGYTMSSGELTALALVSRNWAESTASSGGNDQMIFTTGGHVHFMFGYCESAFSDFQIGDWVVGSGAVLASGTDGRFTGRRVRSVGEGPALMGARLSAAAVDGWVDGSVVMYPRNTDLGTVPTTDDITFGIGQGFFVGAVHSLMVFDSYVPDEQWNLLQEAVRRTWGVL